MAVREFRVCGGAKPEEPGSVDSVKYKSQLTFFAAYFRGREASSPFLGRQQESTAGSNTAQLCPLKDRPATLGRASFMSFLA
jgi:hypothetical protein